jgi:acetyl-CoA acetyltransferase
MGMKDVELWEMHEAFAAQVLSNLQALDSDGSPATASAARPASASSTRTGST